MPPPEYREPEITGAIDLCLPDGRLNREAVAWSRHPLHRCNLRGRWPRKKRWDFWGVTTDTHMLAVTYGCTDYVGTAAVTWLEYEVGKRIEHARVLPFAHGMRFPETVGGGDMRYEAKDLRVALLEEAQGTRLQAWFRSHAHELEADVLVERPSAHETLNVVIPWSDTCFQFTSKQNTRPARGQVRFDGREFPFDSGNQAYGCLDYGRGIWPFRTVWNWGAASGVQGQRVIGLNLGGKWTDGTGMTESGICVDGRLHKVSEPLTWEYDRGNFRRPWRMYAPATQRVDLQFVPTVEVAQHLNLGLVRTELHWVLGHFDGTVVTDAGESISIRKLLGWAEEHRARW